MIRITEIEVKLLKKYMSIEEIVKRYDIVPVDEIEKVITQGGSIQKMCEVLQLPYDRVYHYHRRLRDKKPLKYEREFKIDNALVLNVLNYFDSYQKDNDRPWTMQDLAVQLSDHLPEIPSIGWCQNKLKELEVDWNEYK